MGCAASHAHTLTHAHAHTHTHTRKCMHTFGVLIVVRVLHELQHKVCVPAVELRTQALQRTPHARILHLAQPATCR